MVDAFRLLGFQHGGWGAALLMAASVTVLLSVLGFALGAVFGGLAAAGRLSNSKVLRFLALGYCTVFRGVPDLLTIYLLYYGGSVALTSLGHSLGGSGFVGVPAFATGTLAIAIISGAYQAEVYRGAYLAIDQGQHDAACALGLNRLQRLRQVIFPQLLSYALPGLGNVWQLVLKDSSLISVIGLVELMRQAQIAAGSTREPFIFYIAAALLYLAIASVTGHAFYRLERKAPWRVRSA
ncbi:ABC transporter permease subunit [Mesorhizobium sp. M0815]|uniref:ABC transporter permease n=1 Tax=Mesorhizobium sp. M0815 TaxID=2957005 RepID=UPI003335D1B5